MSRNILHFIAILHAYYFAPQIDLDSIYHLYCQYIRAYPRGNRPRNFSLVYDEPVVLSVEDNKEGAEGGDTGYDESAKTTITLEKLEGVTPATFKIPRRGSFVVRIEKSGYNPVVVHVQTQMATAGGAALAGNICLGGCLGAAVDAGSGATLEHVPSKVTVKLEKQGAEDQPPRETPYSRGGVLLKPGDDGYKSK